MPTRGYQRLDKFFKSNLCTKLAFRGYLTTALMVACSGVMTILAFFLNEFDIVYVIALLVISITTSNLYHKEYRELIDEYVLEHMRGGKADG
jgi:hypothetical protein